MIRLLFKKKKMTGYLYYRDTVYEYQEQEGVVMKELKLEDLIKITGDDWRTESQKLILVEDKIVIDEHWIDSLKL